MASMVWQGILGDWKLAEIHEAPSRPTVADSMVAPFFMTVSMAMTLSSGK
ncbi:MAG: hypothetical protein JO187_00635 [Acidobacteria bacterium]|nr:hypothetical protein [Acidobacteriota bacterium]